jgi:SAM-dependent methyltransferase
MHANAPRRWTSEGLLELGRSYQAAAVFAAAADLDLFPALLAGPRSTAELAGPLGCPARGLAILLDALAALGLLVKRDERYELPTGAKDCLGPDGPHSILAMAQHQANCLRNWAQLARVVKTGRPAERTPSVRGESGDQQAFIGAMHNVSGPVADQVIRGVHPLQFRQLLDVGGASGTWTMAFLRACPEGAATVFDLPHVIPMARARLEAEGFGARVRLAAGDFMEDPLPQGADLAWVSAIVHQNSRAQNRRLFGGVFRALVPGGRIALRDHVMDESRLRPAAGALFAVNMLVATEGGGTFTFAELREDLESAGFSRVVLARDDPTMNSVVVAYRPEAEDQEKGRT